MNWAVRPQSFSFLCFGVMIHWLALGTALLAGAWAAAREPALPLFEQLMRALGIVGPGLQILALIWWMAEVTIVIAVAYALVTAALRPAARFF
jgi:hypothetical protein